MKDMDNIIDFQKASKELKELEALDKIGDELEKMIEMGADPTDEDFDRIFSLAPGNFPELNDMLKGVGDIVTSKKDK